MASRGRRVKFSLGMCALVGYICSRACAIIQTYMAIISGLRELLGKKRTCNLERNVEGSEVNEGKDMINILYV